MKRYKDLSANEKEQAIDICRSRIRRYLAQQTIAINTQLRQGGRRGWCSERTIQQIARGKVDELAEEMAREAHYVESGDMVVMLQMEVV